MLSFFPVSLYLQFTRVANIYFLVIAILQSLPVVSPLNPFSAIAPLVFVLTISMTREGLEDYFRYKSDKEATSTPILIYRDGVFKSLTFKDVAIGDVLLVEKDSAFPCDLILLSSCTENGIAYIETSTLDGEKNLKPRQSLKPTSGLTPESNLNFEFRIECDDPNPKIYHFSGSIEIEKSSLFNRQK